MNILQTLQQLRDDIKSWVTNNLNALNAKIDENTIPIDDKLSATSTNPVQNKAIAEAINNIPRFSGDYNDLTNAPNITEDDSGNMIIADESGNIIFKADSAGIHTTALSLNGETAATEEYVDEAISNIDIPETDLTGYYTKEETNTALDNLKAEISESIVSDSTEWTIVDEEGNIISKINADGFETTTVTAQEAIIDGVNVVSELNTHVENDNIHVTTAEKEAWNNKSDFSGSYNDLTDVPTDLATEGYVDEAVGAIVFPETDLSDYYTKEETNTALDSLKIDISESIVSESEEWKIVDGSGNIIFNVDSDGAHTTSLSLNGEDVINIIDNKVTSLVDSAPDTLNTLNELAAALNDNPNFATTVATEIGKKVDKIDGKNLSTNDFTDEYKNVLDNLGSMAFEETDPTVPVWAKAETKPEYTAEEIGLGNVDNTSDINKPVSIATQTALDSLKAEISESIVSESEEWTVVDSEGNIVATINANGVQTTSMIVESIILNGVDINDIIEAKTKAYIDEAILGGAW